MKLRLYIGADSRKTTNGSFKQKGWLIMEQEYDIQSSSWSDLIRYRATLTLNAKPNSVDEAHTHPERVEIYHFLTGDLFLSFEGRQIPICEGDMVLVADGFLHRPIILKKCRYQRKRIMIHINLFRQLGIAGMELYRTLKKRQILIVDGKTVANHHLSQLFDVITGLAQSQVPQDELYSSLHLTSLIVQIEQNRCDSVSDEQPAQHQRILAITKYIDTHLADDLSYQALAKKFYLSEKYLYKLFKQTVGFSPKDYVIEKRLIKAQSLMDSGIPAGDAAGNVGFSDYSIFYRNFVKHIGITPTEYMKNIRK